MRCRIIAGVLLALHAILVGWLGWRMTPTQDEIAHLPAGLAIWRLGKTDVYSVNPPLTRAIAAVPLLWTQHQEDWSPLADHRLGPRREWALGAAFLQANGRNSWWLMTLARWACLPFTILGGWILWQWSREVWGDAVALVPLALWCSSPNIIGYAALITPDIPSVAMLLLAAWSFHHWLKSPGLEAAAGAGLSLGLAWLTKSQWIILLPIWILLWMLHRWWRAQPEKRPTATQLLVIVAVGWNILCLGYGGRDIGQPLEKLTFYSQRLSGHPETPGNRWSDTVLGCCPSPVPHDFLIGIDLQLRDFEQGRPAYILGTWRERGVWWFYLLGLAVKVPVATLVLAAVGLWIALRHRNASHQLTMFLPLLLPALAVFVIASWQTTLHVYVRYVFCMLPVLYLLAGCAFRWSVGQSRGVRVALSVLLMGALGEGLWHAPHALSFFNAACGGPKQGANILHDANVDWGQDLRCVDEWLKEHPDRRPVTLAWPGLYPTSWVDMDIPTTPFHQLPPGWHLISRNSLTARHGGYVRFRDQTPIETIGGTLLVYRIRADDTADPPSLPTHSD